MSNQDVPPHHRPEDGWWHSVYAGPAGTLPDAPGPAGGEGSVDEWFDTAAGLISHPRAADPPPAPDTPAGRPAEGPPERTPQRTPQEDVEPAPAATAPGPASVDDWFDTAAGVIAPRTATVPAPPAPPRPPAAPWPPVVPPPAPASGSGAGSVDAPEPPTLVLRTLGAPHPATGAEAVPEPQPEPEPTLKLRTLTPQTRATAPDTAPPPAPAPEQVPMPAPTPAPAPAVVLSKPEPAAPPQAPPAPDPTPAPVSAPVVPPVPASPFGRPRPATRRGPLEPPVPHVGERPPTYGPEPTTVPAAEPDDLGAVASDTVLDGAQYGAAILRAASVRGDSARFRGEPRRDALLVTRFGEGEEGLLLAVVASPARGGDAVEGAAAAAHAARMLAATIGRNRVELTADLRAGARDRLRYGLQRLTAGAAAPLRPQAAATAEGESGMLHCLLVSLDPGASHRAAFGTGPGGLYLLRSGHWIDAYAARLLHQPDGEPQPEAASPVAAPKPFRFRLVPATQGDILLLCTPGLAGPIADEPAVARFLSGHWAHPHPPGTVDFLRQVQVRAKGYADDRTAAALWTE